MSVRPNPICLRHVGWPTAKLGVSLYLWDRGCRASHRYVQHCTASRSYMSQC